VDSGDTRGELHTVKEVQVILKSDGHLDYLINNAAMVCDFVISIDTLMTDNQNYAGDDHPSTLRRQPFMDTVISNVLGPALVIQAFWPLMKRSDRKAVVNLTSALASIGGNWGVTSASYSISKSGLNMLVRSAAAQCMRYCSL
jgi:NAD(P)-dependent dehydrogenase (short-subunit alcohol dehydrogenase family)